MTLALEINTRIMAQPRMMAFLVYTEIIRVETKVCETGFEIPMTDDSRNEVSAFKERNLISDTMFVQFAVSQGILSNNVI